MEGSSSLRPGKALLKPALSDLSSPVSIACRRFRVQWKVVREKMKERRGRLMKVKGQSEEVSLSRC